MKSDQDQFTMRPLSQGLGFRNRTIGLPLDITAPEADEDTIDSILHSIQESKNAINAKPQKRIEEYEIAPTKTEPLAVVLDFFAISCGFLMALICLVTMTQSDLAKILSEFDTSAWTLMVLIFTWVGFAYLFLTRALLGATFGEWAFDQILGTPHQQQKRNYFYLVAARAFVVAASGFVAIPVLNKLLKSDLLNQMFPIKLWQVNGTRYIRSRI